MKQIIISCFLLAVCSINLNDAFNREESIKNIKDLVDDKLEKISKIGTSDNLCSSLAKQEIYFARKEVLQSLIKCDDSSKGTNGDALLTRCYQTVEQNLHQKLDYTINDTITCSAIDNCQKVMDLGQDKNDSCVGIDGVSNLAHCSFMEFAGNVVRNVKNFFMINKFQSSTNACIAKHNKMILDSFRQSLDGFGNCQKIMANRLNTIFSSCLSRNKIWEIQSEMNDCCREHLRKFQIFIREPKNTIGSCLTPNAI